MTNNLPPKDAFQEQVVLDRWELQEQVGSGNTAVVYRAREEEFGHEVASKLIPESNLRPGWKKEIEKCGRLFGHQNVLQIIEHGEVSLNSEEFICIITEFIEGPDLKEYIKETPEKISLSFIETVVSQVLEVLHAVQQTDTTHGDLHAGNVMLWNSDLQMDNKRIVKVCDFGIGCSVNDFQPKNDFVQLGDVTREMLETIDRESLNSEDRYYYDFLLNEFLEKRVLELDPTKGDFVGSPRRLSNLLAEGREKASDRLDDERSIELENPFDYLSCEQMGDSFQLINKLYSRNFPGYNQVQGRTHTILTGPRGCGKTTILKNMSLKTKIEAGNIQSVEDIESLSIYYHCRDLYFAFHYMDESIKSHEEDLLVHYFSLSLLEEFLSVLTTLQNEFGLSFNSEALKEFENNISNWISDYSPALADTDLLNHISSMITAEKNRIDVGLRKDPGKKPTNTVPPDFLAPECQKLINSTDLDSDIPVFFLIDDYSTPKISGSMQQVLNDITMERWDQVYFKCSTESITTFHQYDSSGKLLEESREYEVVDLASHFIGDEEKRGVFLKEVINTRLKSTDDIHPKYEDICDILGERPYDSYNDLARKMRSDKKVHYSGFETIRDLFSGDLSEILRIIRGMVEQEEPDHDWSEDSIDIPISEKDQDEQIRSYGGSFLNKIESAPDRGLKLRRIAEVFGRESHQRLLTENSKNQGNDPPFQSFRIEIRDSLSFEPNQDFEEVAKRLDNSPEEATSEEELRELVQEVKPIYDDLLRYGIFLMDTRGKSVRGGVVNRFYLRRLLLPKFNLTPSQRDNIDLEPSEFLFLLLDPDEYDNARFQDRPLSEFASSSGENAEVDE